MPYAAAHSRERPLRTAVERVCRDVAGQLSGARPDLTFVFATPHHLEHLESLAQQVCDLTGTRHLVGCSAEFIAGGSEEIEDEPGISLWSAVLPGAVLHPFHIEFEQTADGLVCTGFPDEAGPGVRAMLLLGDPFTTAVDYIVERLAEDFPGVPLLGGMASAARRPGENRLCLDGATLDHGAVGVLVQGGPMIRSIVSQGCRPVGTPYVVTKAQQNVIFELGGRPPLAQFQELFASMPDRDRELVRNGLHVGIALDEYRDRFARGDFLISNVHGADKESGALAIGNLVRTGQTVQFHVRDAETADEDLRQLVSAEIAGRPRPQAALLFSCNGRGSRLFAEPHHDASTIRELCGEIPLAGFFAAGELGPVAGKNHIHGFTASVALFE
jgi:small ligand-binding sensory domain FIST